MRKRALGDHHRGVGDGAHHSGGHGHPPPHTALACVLLVAAVFLVFARTAGHDFVAYDTMPYLTENPWVLRGLSLEGLAWAFRSFHAANWHPLTWLSHMLDVELFGLNAGAFALENAAWHAANACLVFLWLRRASGAFWRSLLVAALFALHPLHVESVAWVVERKDVLSAFFGLVALLGWTAWARDGRRGGYVVAIVALALGLLAKPMLVSWPLVLLVLDRWPLARTELGWRRSLLEKLPFFVLAAASSTATILAQRAGGAVQGLSNLALGPRLANATVSYTRYLVKTLWPDDLAFYYPHPVRGVSGISAAASIVLLAAITVFALRLRRRAPWFLAGWAFFLVTLAPVIGIVQVGGQAMADRYTYLPLLGIFWIAAWGLGALVATSPRWRPIVVAASGLALAALGVVAWRQAGTWKDTRTLAEHALAVTRGNHVAHDLLGMQLIEDGRLADGERELRAALAIAPGDVDAASNLAAALQRQNRYPESEAVLRKALALTPSRAALHRRLATILQLEERYPEALAAVDAALARDPGDPVSHHIRGQLLEGLGRTPEARAELERSIAIAPRANPARLTLARMLLRLGEVDAADRELARAIADEPTNVEARRGRARVLLSRGREREAHAELVQVLREAPEWPVALGDMTWLLATASDPEVRDPAAAVELGERAQRLSAGRAAGILDALAAAYASAGRFADATLAAQRALARAQETGEVDLAERIEKRLAAYRAGTIDRETPR